jgi:diacylglycerol kinase (CTP)
MKLPSRSDLHLTRKLWHMGMGSIGLIMYLQFKLFTANSWGWGLCILALLAFAMETVRLRNANLNKTILKMFSPFLRQDEQNHYSGLPFYALGCGLSLLFFREDIALLSILFLVFADPISSIMGILYGKTKIIHGKSLEGTLAGFVTCYIISLVYSLGTKDGGFHFILFAALSAAFCALVELISLKIDDNLTIPLFSGCFITILNKFFHIF